MSINIIVLVSQFGRGRCVSHLCWQLCFLLFVWYNERDYTPDVGWWLVGRWTYLLVCWRLVGWQTCRQVNGCGLVLIWLVEELLVGWWWVVGGFVICRTKVTVDLSGGKKIEQNATCTFLYCYWDLNNIFVYGNKINQTLKIRNCTVHCYLTVDRFLDKHVDRIF